MPYKFSPTGLSLLKDCPRCFWLHHNKGIQRPDTIFPSLPGGMDRVLKLHFDSFLEKGKLPPELSSLQGNVELFSNKTLLEVWRSNYKGISWTDAQGNFLRGAVDNILQKNGKLIVLDYKTRGYPIKDDSHHYYQDQMDFYNFLLRKNGYETEDYAYLLFYHPTRVLEGGDVVFHTDMVRVPTDVRNAQRILSEALKALSGNMPASSEKCGFCAWTKKTCDLDRKGQMGLSEFF